LNLSLSVAIFLLVGLLGLVAAHHEAMMHRIIMGKSSSLAIIVERAVVILAYLSRSF